MPTHSFYDLQTGLFSGHTFMTNIAHAARYRGCLKANTPEGRGVIEGVHDHLSRRVDIEQIAIAIAAHAAQHQARVDALRAAFKGPAEGERPVPGRPTRFVEPSEPQFVTPQSAVVDYQPPAPSDAHEWNADTKRWQLTDAAKAAQHARAAALAEVGRLEREMQPGVLRDVALGKPDALEKLTALDQLIEALRAGTT